MVAEKRISRSRTISGKIAWMQFNSSVRSSSSAMGGKVSPVDPGERNDLYFRSHGVHKCRGSVVVKVRKF